MICSVIVVVALVSWAASQSTQESTGTIRGTVTDAMGAVVPNAIVTLTPRSDASLTTGRHQTATSDSEGKFQINTIPPGSYDLSAEAMGMGFRTKSLIVKHSEVSVVNVTLTYEASCPLPTGAKPIAVSASDRAEIVNLIFGELITKNSGFLDRGKDQRSVIVSTRNIDPTLIQPIQNERLIFLTPQQIERRANTKGDFPYIAVDKWSVGNDCVVITVVNRWAQSKKSRVLYMSGGGAVYKFTKEGGKWTGKSVGGWVV
jgi:hypothetical protein